MVDLISLSYYIEALGEMMDRLMTPESGGNPEAGKAALRQMTAAARAQFDQITQAQNDK